MTDNISLPQSESYATSLADSVVFTSQDVQWAKVNENAIIPSKRKEDGCYDIRALPSDEDIVIKPKEIVEVRTGIASAFSPNMRVDVKRERGSSGSIGLVPRCGQIDSGYRGEWFLKFQTSTNATIILTKSVSKVTHIYHRKWKYIPFIKDHIIYYPFTKAVCQAAFEFVPDTNDNEISYEKLKSIPSERGMGKLGSSGK
jgi:dUTP pyrophosphatase